MDEKLYRFLVRTAIGLAVVFGAVILYQTFFVGRAPGDTDYLEGNQLFEDAAYERALEKYDRALEADPEHLFALRGRARALMQLGRFDEAMAAYDEAIARDPDFGATWANRGILNDRMGRHEKAAEDYEKALSLDPELAEGPHWLTRFLRKQADRPPGIGERAAYIRAELAKPRDERLLRVPELDAEQRPYKQ